MVVTVPVLVVIALSSVRVTHARSLLLDVEHLRRHYERTVRLSDIVHAVQAERRAVCLTNVTYVLGGLL